MAANEERKAAHAPASPKARPDTDQEFSAKFG
jgi:hypothetical protein